ncbi:hypothetical protein DFH08DRAFT_825250 [Mycena albidolilacea]|uniref:Uncharacterized protein n=1 Tax=Mycena albidolilacea TaxID=1033008 RepID=A0AAD6Z2J5_9AGAR|nr:hypothetical protein DFH08DRAFT_825250 [Mycena albidolilacea]
MPQIPADFVRVLRTTPSYYTGESWAFWFIYLAPILLKDRFSDGKYYTHLCELSDIIQGCLRFTLTMDQVNELRQAIIAWIHKYEEYYYQHLENRLRVCTLTVHGMAGLRSKCFPWANLNNNVLHVAYLEQLNARYDLEAELSSASKMQRAAACTREYAYEEYPQAVRVPPYQRHHVPTKIIRDKIADHFSGLLGKRPHQVLSFIPEKIPSFGKLRIVQGDSIRSASACGDGATAERDMSFIRYEIESRPTTTAAWVVRISYGRLERVLECTLPSAKELQHLAGKTRLLAVISPCLNTQGKDAALVRTSYRDIGDPIVTDFQAVVAVVGRVERRDRWYIVDRTGGLICPEFFPEDEDVDNN